MLKNYFIIATRHLAKNKVFSVINIFGLALGMSLNLVFISLLSFAFSYDDFHTKKDQIYRVITQVHDNIENPKYASAPAGLTSKLREGFSGIERVVPVQSTLSGYAAYSNRELYLNGYFADPDFLQTFDFPLEKGTLVQLLKDPIPLFFQRLWRPKFLGKKNLWVKS